MICEKRFKSLTEPVGSVQESMSKRESKVAIRTAANIEKQADKEPTVTVNAHVNSGVQVFLQTAIAQVSKANHLFKLGSYSIREPKDLISAKD